MVGVLRLARRAAPPVDDLGFVDLESVIIFRGEARRKPDRAVNIEHFAAASADQVMMVVAHPIFVQSRRTCRLDPANQSLFNQQPFVILTMMKTGFVVIKRFHQKNVLTVHQAAYIKDWKRLAMSCDFTLFYTTLAGRAVFADALLQDA